MMRKTIGLVAGITLACLALTGCVSEGYSYTSTGYYDGYYDRPLYRNNYNRVIVYDRDRYSRYDRYDRYDRRREQRAAVYDRDRQVERRAEVSRPGREGRYVTRDGRRIWLPREYRD
jgi:hypothetical protein